MNTLILLLLLSSDPTAVEQALLDPKIIYVDGEDRICFQVQTSQKLLKIVTDYPRLQEEIKHYSNLIDILDGKFSKLLEIKNTLDKQMLKLYDMNYALMDSVKEQSSWYYSPVVWATFGIIVGAAASTTAIVLLRR